ncbi:MAG: ABC transporter substrate-binding protein [Bacteroidetes bacterium]|nr:ABC transporter substrate-binding protein [Bacteroidota bacterium]
MYISKNNYINILVLVSFLATACFTKNSKPTETTAEKDISNEYANYFQIIQNDSNTIVFKTKSTLNKQTTYHIGNFKKSYLSNDTFYIPKQIKKIICLSTLYASYLDNLQSLETVVGIDNSNYVFNQSLLNKIEQGDVSEVGETGNLNLEKIISLKPDLIITYGNESNANPYQKLTENNIPILYVYDYLENHPLGRAEWLKVFGLLTNKYDSAENKFNQIKNRYLNVKTIAEKATKKPTVFFEIALSDVWYMPGGKSYLSNLANDAGANYIWKDDAETGSLKLSIEEVMQKAHKADYWLNQHYSKSLNDLLQLNKKYNIFESFKNKNVYNNILKVNVKGGNAFWENGLIHADSLLTDAVKIFHPELLPQHNLVYYKKLE